MRHRHTEEPAEPERDLAPCGIGAASRDFVPKPSSSGAELKQNVVGVDSGRVGLLRHILDLQRSRERAMSGDLAPEHADTAPEPEEDLVLAQLRALGADLSQPRDVRHYLYFPSEASARAAERELAELGYTTEVDSATDSDEVTERPWRVLASAERVADEKTVPQETTRMSAVAAKLAGEYDGWEAAL